MAIYASLVALLLIWIFVECRKEKIIQNYSHCVSLDKKRNNRSLKIIYFLVWFMLLIVFSLRDFSVGVDTITYKNMYQDYSTNNIGISKEPVFWTLVFLSKILSLPFSCFLFIIGTICFLCFYKFVQKYSLNKCLSLLLFVTLGIYASAFNGVRQFLALSFFILAIDRMIEKDLTGYIGFVLFAYLSHSSAIILFPIYIIRHIRINWKFILCTSILCVLSIIFLPSIVKLISKFTARDYYGLYYVQGAFSSSISLYNVLYSIAMIACFAFLYYIRKYVESKSIAIYNVFLNLFYIAVCARVIATYSGFFMLVNRFTMFFFWSLLILIPFSIKYFFVEKLKYCFKWCVIIISLLYYIVSASIRNSNGIYPYNLVFENYSLLWWIFVVCYSSLMLFILINLRKYYDKGKCFGKTKNQCNCASIQC